MYHHKRTSGRGKGPKKRRAAKRAEQRAPVLPPIETEWGEIRVPSSWRAPLADPHEPIRGRFA